MHNNDYRYAASLKWLLVKVVTRVRFQKPPLPTSVQPISITKTLLIVPTKNERDPPLFTGKLLIKFQNILRNTTQVIIRHSKLRLFADDSIIYKEITCQDDCKKLQSDLDAAAR